MNTRLGIAFSIVATVGANAVQAAPLFVDFTERLNQSVVQPDWSSFILNSSSNNFADGKFEGLTTARTFGEYTVTVSDTNGTVAAQLPYLTDRKRTGPTNGGSITLANMLQDFVMADNATAGQGLNVVVSGLVPNTLYEGRIWSYDHAQATNTTATFLTDWSVNSTLVVDNYSSKGPAPTADNDKSFAFQAIANGSGQLVIEARRDSASTASGVLINGLYLEQVPEPGSAALVGLAGLGLLARRRSSSSASRQS